MIKKWSFISGLTTRPGSPEKVLQSKISLECQRRKKTSHEASKDAVKQKKSLYLPCRTGARQIRPQPLLQHFLFP